MDERPIGRLAADLTNHGLVVIGYCCLTSNEQNDPAFVPVYYVNIGPLYSQHCFRCKKLLVDGTSDVELFDGR